jgi:hypothetical protein
MQERVVAGHSLSPQQVRLWLLQRGRTKHAYNARCAVVIEGDPGRYCSAEGLCTAPGALRRSAGLSKSHGSELTQPF